MNVIGFRFFPKTFVTILRSHLNIVLLAWREASHGFVVWVVLVMGQIWHFRFVVTPLTGQQTMGVLRRASLSHKGMEETDPTSDVEAQEEEEGAAETPVRRKRKASADESAPRRPKKKMREYLEETIFEEEKNWKVRGREKGKDFKKGKFSKAEDELIKHALKEAFEVQFGSFTCASPHEV